MVVLPELEPPFGLPLLPPTRPYLTQRYVVVVVRPLGFEPRTCGLRVRCSAVELEAPAPDSTYPLLGRNNASTGPG